LFVDFEEAGFEIIPSVLTAEACDKIIRLVGEPGNSRQPHLAAPEILPILRASSLAEFFEKPWQIIRSLYFDKTPDANWSVPCHQDLTICIRERRDVLGFTSWSIKEGIHHVTPPIEILEEILTIRIHLDDCGAENGPLRVVPKSHRYGKLSDERVQKLRANEEVTCIVPKGGALLMRPLLLHASSRATSPNHSRVLHIEVTRSKLPHGLDWLGPT
jgi:ectoine hydroxylase-related dioxygenase (phytanoyl-CoA dioxygenase family)